MFWKLDWKTETGIGLVMRWINLMWAALKLSCVWIHGFCFESEADLAKSKKPMNQTQFQAKIDYLVLI